LGPLLRIAIEVPEALAEVSAARLLELVPGGLEETTKADLVELAVYVAPGDEPSIRSVFPEARITEVAPGWEERWRAFHRPIRVGVLWIGPPWDVPPAGSQAVIIDPGLAFGTGAHATTRLCLELLARQPRGSLLDVGCGSGVLAIAASRLGFDPVVAVDNDPVAVAVTLANAAVNEVSLEARLADGTIELLPRVDVAVANVLLAPVAAILARLDSTIAVTSGYLVGEQPRVEGWTPIDRLELDGWAADVFRRGP
jgi:ribosomal protein L11 methyltransferase